jgi:hypothetical protein
MICFKDSATSDYDPFDRNPLAWAPLAASKQRSSPPKPSSLQKSKAQLQPLPEEPSRSESSAPQLVSLETPQRDKVKYLNILLPQFISIIFQQQQDDSGDTDNDQAAAGRIRNQYLCFLY